MKHSRRIRKSNKNRKRRRRRTITNPVTWTLSFFYLFCLDYLVPSRGTSSRPAPLAIHLKSIGTGVQGDVRECGCGSNPGPP